MVEQVLDPTLDSARVWSETSSLHSVVRVGPAAEVANAIVCPASARSLFVTGTGPVVDGGLTAT